MELDFRKNPAILSNMVDVMADGVFTIDDKGHIVARFTTIAKEFPTKFFNVCYLIPPMPILLNNPMTTPGGFLVFFRCVFIQ
jgi:hypothetical protein